MTVNKPLVLGIAGGTGSGKTTVAEELCARLGEGDYALVNQDSYYKDNAHLTLEERRRLNYDHPDVIDLPLLVAHVKDLIAGRPIHKPVYSFVEHTRTGETVLVQPRPLIIVEGILVLHFEDLRRLMDIKLFVDTDADVRFIRRLERDIRERGRTQQSVIEQYLTTVRPMHLEFVEPSKRHADVIIPEGGFNRIAIEMIVSQARAQLASRRRGEAGEP
ncbi:MAG: uridine kinase [Candidatus Sumerlaeia bacterium]